MNKILKKMQLLAVGQLIFWAWVGMGQWFWKPQHLDKSATYELEQTIQEAAQGWCIFAEEAYERFKKLKRTKKVEED